MKRETTGTWLLALALALTATPQIAAADAVTDWDKIACDIVGTSKVPTPLGVRTIAITQTAVYEAVNRITRRFPGAGGGQPPGASVEAAIAAANRAALTALVPDQIPAIEAVYLKAVDAVADGDAKSAGIAIGERAATEILAKRAEDGSSAAASYRPVTAVGVYVPTTISVGSQWPQRKPWLLTSAAQFRPGPPPALDSAVWARDYNEVKALGARNGSSRSAEQTEIARFWEATKPSIYHGVVRAVADQIGRASCRERV